MLTSIPRATYRWQFHAGFTFAHARKLVPYLRDLGISHVYSSPFFQASPGSMHGYDVSDPNAINPEIGTEAELEALAADLQRHGMGLIVDFVPNHMGVGDDSNQWWLDVLQHGQSSPFAKYFDIEWAPLKPEMHGKVLYPVLADQYGRMLESGKFKIRFTDGAFFLNYESFTLPLAPRSVLPVLQRAAELLEIRQDEFDSIITALRNLPPRSEQDPARIEERLRETRVTHRRLDQLTRDDPSVAKAIETAIAEWQKPGDPESMDRLDALISSQAFRLSYWRVAAEEINYRRFFDINTLAGVRVEIPEVFQSTHRLLLDLVARGIIQGIRIDHIDGLARPRAYLETLREEVNKRLPNDEARRAFYIVVEKILTGDERLRSGWNVQGTTGYEFASEALRLLIDPESQPKLDKCFDDFVDLGTSSREIMYRSKKLVMQTALASEVNMLGIMLGRLAQGHRWYRDFTVNSLTTAVREVIACFPVYRTYIEPESPPDQLDMQVLSRAISQARRRNPAIERSVFEFLEHVLDATTTPERSLDEELRCLFVLKFQQCTGPVTAKGVEDTTFYIWNRFVALNEVGSHPGEFSLSPEAFHHQCQARVDFPYSMLGTSTHDTKRSEDVRARLAVISEFPQHWERMVMRWRSINAVHKVNIHGEQAPDANEEYLLYQTIVGTWPLQRTTLEQRRQYLKRIQEYMLKAIREAKVNSSWIEPNDAWHDALNAFIAAVIDVESDQPLPEFVQRFIQRIAPYGAINSLAQTVLKITIPGVPDIYQGTEMWDFSLVDPDNRRPVDYPSRTRQLRKLNAPAAQHFGRWRDGSIKLFTINRLLDLRRQHADLFQDGSYHPVHVQGAFAGNCLAFERRHGGKALLVVVPRLCSQVDPLPVGDAWQDTRVHPETVGDRNWRDIFTGATHPAATDLQLSSLLREIPYAVLIAEG